MVQGKLLEWFEQNETDVISELSNGKELPDELRKEIEKAVDKFFENNKKYLAQ